jgi:HEAT repeat protein
MEDNFKIIDDLFAAIIERREDVDYKEVISKLTILANQDKQYLKYIITFYENKEFFALILAMAVIKEVGQIAVPHLIDYLGDNHKKPSDSFSSLAQFWIADNLGDFGDKKAIPILIKLLDNEKCQVRVGAIQALGKLEAVEALPKIEYIAEHDEALYGWFDDPIKDVAAQVAEKLRQHL